MGSLSLCPFSSELLYVGLCLLDILPCSGGRGQSSHDPRLVDSREKRASLFYQPWIDGQTNDRKEARKKREKIREESHLALLGSRAHLQWLGRWGIMTGQTLMTCHLCHLGEREPHEVGERQFCMLKGLLLPEGRQRCRRKTSGRQCSGMSLCNAEVSKVSRA